MKFLIKQFLMFFLTIILITGCVTTDWKNARSKGTIDAYQAFLNKHPDSEYTKEAKKRIYSINLHHDWIKATKVNAIEAYQAFIEKYHKSRGNVFDRTTQHRIKQAQKKIDDFIDNDYKYAKRKNTIKILEEFIANYLIQPVA